MSHFNLIIKLGTRLRCLFLQITSKMTNKNVSILLIHNLFFGFNTCKSYFLIQIHMKLLSGSLLNWIIYSYIFPLTSIFIYITLKSLDLMLLLSHDCSCFCHNNIGFDCMIPKNNLLFPSSSLMREDKLVSKIQNSLLIPFLNFISQIRDIIKHNLRMTLQDISVCDRF